MMSLYLQGERGYLGDAHRPDLSPDRGRRADLLAAVGSAGRPLRARPSLVVAGVLITAASLMLTFLTATTPVWQLLVIFAVFGIGFSMVNAPITNAAVSGMPLDRAGAASAVTSTSRQIGVSIGVALCGSVAGSALAHTGADFASAARPLWFICAGLGLVIFALGSVLDVAAGDALGRAARAADCRIGMRDARGPMSGSRSGRRGVAGDGPLVIDNRDGWKRAVVEQTGLPFSRIRVLARLGRAPMTVKQVRRGGDHGCAGRDRRGQRPRRSRAGGAQNRSDQSAVQGGVVDRRRPRDGRTRSTPSTIRRPMSWLRSTTRAQRAEGDRRQAREIALAVVDPAIS